MLPCVRQKGDLMFSMAFKDSLVTFSYKLTQANKQQGLDSLFNIWVNSMQGGLCDFMRGIKPKWMDVGRCEK